MKQATKLSNKTDRIVLRDLETPTVLEDYYIAQLSRNLSILGRKEVLNGKAKFGIFGDGKELAQIAMAKTFKDGDWRSGYYRDQTFMLAIGNLTPAEFFLQMYGDTDTTNNPASSGRNFNNHFASANYNSHGEFLNLMSQKNTAGDISPTAGQMPRLLGLAYASKLFRENKDLHKYSKLSASGNEVAFGTIGDAATSEGHFFETINAAAVLQVPLAIAVWDDGYGISVPKSYQTTKSSISEALKGFEQDENNKGIKIFKARGWNYEELVSVFREGVDICRAEHVPALFHIYEMNQPLGHSTSGSHERYKSKERLEWEMEFDPLLKMREWILENKIGDEARLLTIEEKAVEEARKGREEAWKRFTSPLIKEKEDLLNLIKRKNCTCATKENQDKVDAIVLELSSIKFPIRKDILSAGKKILRQVCLNCTGQAGLKEDLKRWLRVKDFENADNYSSHLYNETTRSALNVKEIAPVFSENSQALNGREIIRENFDKLFDKYPLLTMFGEDVGKIGGVNQTLEGLQAKYGEIRITDTGIREATILGQGIGMALRGMRPIVEIQYFDYLLYALQTLSDDLACTHWRTKGRQAAPVIISTRGHRLEGIWHSGSPMGMVISTLRGVYVCVPRNMVQAAGMYNTLMQADDPAIVIEPLNGYRLKEICPDNIGEYTVPLGEPDILLEGSDITLVTYGSCVKIALEACAQLKEFGISVELIDIQTLLPFDLHHVISKSVRKTSKVVFFDEDVPGGASAYMMQKVLEEQGGFRYLELPPVTITGEDHRPAYSTDGDYFSNPNAEDVFDKIYQVMSSSNPNKYKSFY
jgi:pyruvate/2-oxoglutarate/acetoin dehydrogenase E1 component/TPP-dependent pyruvate/acetoin dehydrogenase alpha subunit